MYSPGVVCPHPIHTLMAELTVTTKDAEQALDTACSNPDTKEFKCPPDGVRGLSTLTRQKIVQALALTSAADIWIVQWDHEPVNGGQCGARFVCTSTVEDAPGFKAGHFSFVADISSSWASSGYAESVVTGGLCIYIMPTGKSPFPASGNLVGPWPPTQVFCLGFGDDLLHDLVRVLGSNHELVDTTNQLNQQGNCFQGAWDAQQDDLVPVQFNSLATDGNQVFTAFMARASLCPPGDSESLIKLNNNRVAAAKEGYFTMNRLDMCNNKPVAGTGNVAMYESINNHPALAGQRIYLASYPFDDPIDVATTTPPGTVSIITNATQQVRTFMTGVQMNCTILTGLNPSSYAANITREITTQCFIRPGSQYSAFAALNHTPVNSAVLDAMQNVMDNLEMFAPSKSNKNGRFAKLAKGLWKKVNPIVRPIVASAGMGMLDKYTPEGVKNSFTAAQDVYNQIQSQSQISPDAMTPTVEQLMSFAKAAKKKVRAAKGEGPTGGQSSSSNANKKGKKGAKASGGSE